jgi:hypothetical protein
MANHARLQHGGGAVPTTLVGSLTNVATSCVLAASTNWPDGTVGPFYIVVDAGTATEEKILATSRSSNTLNTLVRGADGTTAQSHVSGASVAHIFSADEADEANAFINRYLGVLSSEKGRMVVPTAAGVLGSIAPPLDNYVLTGDTTAAQGMAFKSLAFALQTFIHWNSWSATPNGASQITVLHHATFTPTYVSLDVMTPFATTPSYGQFITADATSAVFQMTCTSGTVIGVPLTGFLVAYL